MAVCQQHLAAIVDVTSWCCAERHMQQMVLSRWTLPSASQFARRSSVKNLKYGQCPLDIDDLKIKVASAFTHISPEMLSDTVRTGLQMCSRVSGHWRIMFTCETLYQILCKIWGSHSAFEDSSLLRHKAMSLLILTPDSEEFADSVCRVFAVQWGFVFQNTWSVHLRTDNDLYFCCFDVGM